MWIVSLNIVDNKNRYCEKKNTILSSFLSRKTDVNVPHDIWKKYPWKPLELHAPRKTAATQSKWIDFLTVLPIQRKWLNIKCQHKIKLFSLLKIWFEYVTVYLYKFIVSDKFVSPLRALFEKLKYKRENSLLNTCYQIRPSLKWHPVDNFHSAFWKHTAHTLQKQGNVYNFFQLFFFH